ncbi:MAG TPA: PKD domain-containing protein, partial [Puia sp.]
MIRIRFVLFCCLYGIGPFSAHAQVPVADFSASTVSGCGPLGVTFQDLSTNKPLSWTWDFGNGQISNQQNPPVIYSAPGSYTVTLIAKNASGAGSIRKTGYITVYPYPNPSFTADLTVGCAPASIQFTDKSTAGQGVITNWTWNFGDGNTSNQQNPSHIFTQTGYYDIALTAVNSGGCRYTGIVGRYIRVIPGVQAAFSWSQSSPGCSAPFNINFINQTSGPGTLSYNWDLGNSTTSAQANPPATYPSNNPYTVTLIANSTLGCGDTVVKTISFQGSTPVITAPDQACVNTPVNFQNGSSPAPPSSSWDFGDGTTAAVANPTKSYTATGTYTVTLTNTYSSCTAPVTKTIQIVNTPVASFSADKTTSCKAPLTVNFTDLTPGSMGSQWDFGDGSTGTGQTAQHTYMSMGNFTVTLTSTTGTGCTAVSTQTNFIRMAAPAIGLGEIQGCIAPALVYPKANIFAPDG